MAKPNPGYDIEDRGHESLCWIWRGYLDRDGYAKSNGKYVHRENYQARHGSVPEGMHLDHLCQQRACVNPEHLEAVTPSTNARRSANGSLTPELVCQIREAEGTIRTISEQFGIAKSHVHRIRRGEVWADV